MSESNLKYQNNIITDALPWPAEVKQNGAADLENLKDIRYTHLMNVDANRVEDFFCVDCYWLWEGASETPVEVPHTHDFGEAICFVGTNEDDPYDLGGEITIWLDDDKQVIKRTSLIYLPPGTRHGPIVFNRIERPVFFVTISPTGIYRRSAVGDAAVSTALKDGDKPRYTIISHSKEQTPETINGEKVTPPAVAGDARGSHLLHLEDDMAAGSFYLDFVWIYEGTGYIPTQPHDHEWPELLAITGCDSEHPYDIGGKTTIELDGEIYESTKSNMVCLPARVTHCPWKFIDIKKPTLIFTTSPSGTYYSSNKDRW